MDSLPSERPVAMKTTLKPITKSNLHATCVAIRLAGVAVAMASMALPLAAQARSDTNAQQLYRDALSACNGSERTQSRADCMNEARSVLRDAKEGRAWTRDGDMQTDTQTDMRMDRDTQRTQRTQRNQSQERQPR